jgi:hypothetical protein
MFVSVYVDIHICTYLYIYLIMNRYCPGQILWSLYHDDDDIDDIGDIGDNDDDGNDDNDDDIYLTTVQRGCHKHN